MLSDLVNSGDTYRAVYELDRTMLLCCLCHKELEYTTSHRYITKDPYYGIQISSLTDEFIKFLGIAYGDNIQKLYIDEVEKYRLKYGNINKLYNQNMKNTNNLDNIDTSIN